MVKTTHKLWYSQQTALYNCINQEQRDLCFNLLVKYVTYLHPWSRLFTSISYILAVIHSDSVLPYDTLQLSLVLSLKIMGFNFHFSSCKISSASSASNKHILLSSKSLLLACPNKFSNLESEKMKI